MRGAGLQAFLLLCVGAATVSSTGGQVHSEGNRTALSGQPCTLSCRYNGSSQVQQVQWKKMAGQGSEGAAIVAWYVDDNSHAVKEPFQGRVSLSPSLDVSHLTFLQPGPEDEACYICQFNTFPGGSRESVACLTVVVTTTKSPSGDTQVNSEKTTVSSGSSPTRVGADWWALMFAVLLFWLSFFL